MRILSEKEYEDAINCINETKEALLRLKSQNDLLEQQIDEAYNRGFVDNAKMHERFKFTFEDMEAAIQFGYMQNLKNGCIEESETKVFYERIGNSI